ncbi:MAG: hypothetical protein RMK20_11005, partial [Verrucomicrobiales bacterium]|nr:hypothetical protein [Verrucomicrobiales bacterium]
AEEMLGVPRYGADGKPVKHRTEVERYYDDLDRARAAAQAAVTNRAARDALNAKFFGEEEELKPLNLKLFEEPVSPFAQQTDERNKPATQKSEFPGFADLAAPRNGPRDFAEIFGFSSGHKTPGFTVDAEAFQSRKRHVEDLISLRFVNAAGAGANSLPGLGSAPAALMQNPAAAGPNLPASAASTAGSGGSLGSPGAGLGGIFNPATSPGSGLPSLAGPPASAGLQPTWSAPTPPPPTQPKLSPTPFQIPQRKF